METNFNWSVLVAAIYPYHKKDLVNFDFDKAIAWRKKGLID